jgi:hypothetical protein
MKHLKNFLCAFLFGLVVSADLDAAPVKQEPIGVISPILSSLCADKPQGQQKLCYEQAIALMRFSRSIGISETSCSLWKATDLEVQERCEEYEDDPDVKDFYNWVK